MTANYPTKCWYVAATSDELGDAPLARRLLGRDIVLWRSAGRRGRGIRRPLRTSWLPTLGRPR